MCVRTVTLVLLTLLASCTGNAPSSDSEAPATTGQVPGSRVDATLQRDIQTELASLEPARHTKASGRTWRARAVHPMSSELVNGLEAEDSQLAKQLFENGQLYVEEWTATGNGLRCKYEVLMVREASGTRLATIMIAQEDEL